MNIISFQSMTRDERQEEVLNNLWINNHHCLFIGATGFGKTRIALKSIIYSGSKDITVIVPTKYLKEQWEGHLEEIPNIQYQVLVINTASTMSFYTEYLIIDECHTACSDEWSKVLTNIESKYFLGLTATERQDDKWQRILDKAPIADIVTLEECIKNDWVAEHEVLVYPIKLTTSEQSSYDKANKSFEYNGKLLKAFGKDPMSVAQGWLSMLNIKKNRDKYVIYVKDNILYKKDTVIEKYKPYKMSPEWHKFRELTDADVEIYFKRAMVAKNYYAAIRKRKEIINNAELKIPLINTLLSRHELDKTIVFGESIEFLYRLNHNNCFYHSKLSTKVNNKNIDDFITDETNVIFSAKALNTGVDIPGVNVGVVSSYNSSKLIMTQSLGRIVRKEGNKQSVMYYIYVPNTQDEVWLNNALGNINYKMYDLETNTFKPRSQEG